MRPIRRPPTTRGYRPPPISPDQHSHAYNRDAQRKVARRMRWLRMSGFFDRIGYVAAVLIFVLAILVFLAIRFRWLIRLMWAGAS